MFYVRVEKRMEKDLRYNLPAIYFEEMLPIGNETLKVRMYGRGDTVDKMKHTIE